MMTMKTPVSAVGLLSLLALAACHSGSRQPPPDQPSIPGDRADTRPYDGIAPNDIIHATGTEPFWSITAAGETLSYTTPDKPEARSVPASRFAGRGGLSYSGTLDGAAFTMAVSPGKCSDGMSDRTYPFVVTLKLGDAVRDGCGWTDAHPFAGSPRP